MEPTPTPAPKLGLRERKKRRTRQAILSAALELFSDRGYTHTTLEDIAEAAEVSTGTLFAYFPSKEDILFPEERPFYEQLNQRLEQRPSGASTLDVLRELLATLEPPDETLRLRAKILRDERLLDRHRTRYTRVERLLAESIAKDLGTTLDDLRPTLLAAATSAALSALGERFESDSGRQIRYDQALGILEQMLDALRGEFDGPQATTGQRDLDSQTRVRRPAKR